MVLVGVTIGLGLFLHIHSSSCTQFVIKVPDSEIGQVKQNQPLTKNMLPAVINTWAFTNATKKGIDFLHTKLVIGIQLFCI